MMTSIVAIDIETTGLDPDKDSIIEIGVERFKGHRIEKEWTTLINPGRHIPEFISGLTGISDEMVRQAPRIQDILHDFEVFIGDAPVLGHNVRFDLGFLQKYRVLELNQVIDTYELASVLLPSASRYNLGTLGKTLGIFLPATHRAMDDARLTQAIFTRLHKLANELPLNLIEEIVRLSEPLDWDASWFFRQVLRVRSHEGVSAKQSYGLIGGSFKTLSDQIIPPLQPVTELIPLDPEVTAAILEHGGPFSKVFPDYEFRVEQVEMVRAVTHSLSDGHHLMVEAGTGVGKSFAYLIPAAKWATQNNTSVLISTNTINLQDQLIKKDIPDLCQALGLNLRATVLKGRANYLCPRRLNHLRQYGPKTAEEMRVLAKILVWLLENTSGDRAEINLTGSAERDVWIRISAEDDACTNETCIKSTGGSCPFYRVRQSAQSAHLLIVNHALLLSDVVTDSHVLPDYAYLIVDEAHHLENATTNALSFRLTKSDLERVLREVGGSGSGVLGRLLLDTRDILRPSEYASLSQKISQATDLAFRLQNSLNDFFQSLGAFVAAQRENQQPGNYPWQERILPSTRTQPGWYDIENSWDSANNVMQQFLKMIDELYQGATELYTNGMESLEDVISTMSSVYRRLNETNSNIDGMISNPSSKKVYWIEIQPNGDRLTMRTAPLYVRSLIEKYLWHEKSSVILTSATLTTHGQFDYIRNILGADEADELALGSPFDYENSTLLLMANDIPEPNAPGYQQAVDRTLIQLCKVAGGRTLVLFTSYAQLKRTAKNINGPLTESGILVFEQGEGASPNTLLENFKESEQAVLLGTRSFWEGVDIPGQALSVVVIVKLPFDVPTDPLLAARSETYDDPFNEYYLPEAILKFRQGFGRLIRTKSDRGVVVILDRRLQTKAYGRFFLESLPQCTVKVGPLVQLPSAALQWLDL
jgi:DNA polymerase-3 subunit epsilon/ATP-dependent DNA helicase DinG